MKPSLQNIASSSAAIRNATADASSAPASPSAVSNQVHCTTNCDCQSSLMDCSRQTALASPPSAIPTSSSVRSMLKKLMLRGSFPVYAKADIGPHTSNSPQPSKTFSKSMPPHRIIKQDATANHQPESGQKTVRPRSTSRDSNLSRPGSGLRRVSSNYEDLRGAAMAQYIFRPALPSSTPESPLLPSPIIDDRKIAPRGQSDQPSSSAAISRCSGRRSGLGPLSDSTTPSSYELSCDEPDNFNDVRWDLKSLGAADHYSVLSSSVEASPTSMEFSKTLSSSSNDSCASDWLANALSHEERQRRFKARCCQIVQHSSPPSQFDLADKEESDERIMLATILVGPGKPKLVRIQRPPSSNVSLDSKENLASSFSPCMINTIPRTKPTTPNRSIREISAFSPYDTSAEPTPMSYTEKSKKMRLSTHTRTGSLTAENPENDPRRPKSIQDHCPSLSFSSASTQSHPSSHQPKLSSPRPSAIWSTSSDFATSQDEKAGSRSCDLENSSTTTQSRNSFFSSWSAIVNTATLVANMFPQKVLLLDSPQIAALRKSQSSGKDHLLLESLSSVFPTASSRTLSAVAAWRMLDTYVDGMLHESAYEANSEKRRSKPPLPKRTPSILVSRMASHAKSLRIFTSLSTGSVHTSPSSRQSLKLRTMAASEELTTRKSESSGMPTAATTQYDCTSIPAKARHILGIEPFAHETDVWSNEKEISLRPSRLIGANKRAVQSSIKIVTRKLMRLAKEGSSHDDLNGMDEELWRAIGLIVVLVEEGNVSRERCGVDARVVDYSHGSFCAREDGEVGGISNNFEGVGDGEKLYIQEQWPLKSKMGYT